MGLTDSRLHSSSPALTSLAKPAQVAYVKQGARSGGGAAERRRRQNIKAIGAVCMPSGRRLLRTVQSSSAY